MLGRFNNILQATDQEYPLLHCQKHHEEGLPFIHRTAIQVLQKAEQAAQGPRVFGEREHP
jgi:hypothetical protein